VAAEAGVCLVPASVERLRRRLVPLQPPVAQVRSSQRRANDAIAASAAAVRQIGTLTRR
jgi:hypothetical protein